MGKESEEYIYEYVSLNKLIFQMKYELNYKQKG